MLRSGTRGGRYVIGLVILMLLGLGTLAWLERTSLLAWFHVRLLLQAGDSNREARAAQVAQLGECTVPGLLEGLHQEQTGVCDNIRAALSVLARPGGELSESRATDLVTRLARDFGHFSQPGQRHVLEMTAEWFQSDPAAAAVPGLMPACGRLLAAAQGATDSEVQSAGLDLCQGLLAQPQGSEVLSTGREMVRSYLQSPDVAVRVKAIRVALHPGMDLLDTVAGLLHDQAVEVRRVAIVAVGPADKVVLDEVLLPSLRDPDREVRQFCETALRGRGLGPEHLELARLLTDPQPLQRMRVLEYLHRATDLDPGVWYRRLSQDPDSSVRAAAIRKMGQQTTVDLTDRLEQMAQRMQNPTVSYLAGFYLKIARALQAEQGSEVPGAPSGPAGDSRN